MNNEFLKYTSKDYNSIFTDLVAAIPTLTDLWTNTEDGDPGIVLVKLMSALGDMLSYNADKQALEYYSSTVTQRKNAAKLFNLIGYKMHWYRSATNRISVTNTQVVPMKYRAVPIFATYTKYLNLPVEERPEDYDIIMQGLINQYTSMSQWFFDSHSEEDYPQYYQDGEPNYPYTLANNNSELVQEYESWVAENTINIFTYLGSTSRTIDVRSGYNTDTPYIIKPTTAANITPGDEYITPTDSIKPGETHDFDVIQGTLCSIKFNSIRMRNNRYYFSESNIDENNIWLSYDSTDSTGTTTSQKFIDKTDNLLTITDGNVYFEFGVDDFDLPYIELSSYWVNQLENSVDFTLYYVRTSGLYGNITKNYLNTIEGIARSSYKITHPSNGTPYIDSDGKLIATPGYHPQTAHQAYVDSINYVTTFDSLVTIYDFERFCKRQPGISNTYAVDKQRAIDINNALQEECENLSLAQLQAFYNESKNPQTPTPTNISVLREFYINRKTVKYNELDNSKTYEPYSLNLHVVYGEFDLSMSYTDGLPDPNSSIATMTWLENQFWLYKIDTNYEIEYQKDVDGNYIRDDDGNKIPAHKNYNSIEEVTGSGRVAHYLDEKIRDTKIVTTCPEYAGIRVFPWRCCGVIHLKNPVTETVANKILETVMEHLAAAFHPANIEFGKKIDYMDVITVVTSAHDMIRYFDAGLASRKLIDIDDSVDITYFNNTSLMYYVQSPQGFSLGAYGYMEGNNTAYKHDSDVENPYYKILSIAPEYIIK